MFEPQVDSAWLKCLILKFCLVAESSLHEAGPTLSESESSVSSTSGQTHYTKPTTEQHKTSKSQASSTMPPSNKSVGKNKKQKQAPRSSATAKSKSDTQKSSAKSSREEQPASVHHQQASERSSAHAHKAMAVPVTSDDHKAAVNGLSKRGALDVASTGDCLQRCQNPSQDKLNRAQAVIHMNTYSFVMIKSRLCTPTSLLSLSVHLSCSSLSSESSMCLLVTFHDPVEEAYRSSALPDNYPVQS